MFYEIEKFVKVKILLKICALNKLKDSNFKKNIKIVGNRIQGIRKK